MNIRSSRHWATGLVLLSLVAAACSGSTTTTIAESQNESPSTDSVQATEPTAVPEPTVMPEPTAVPTTAAEPTAAPEPTVAPEPTDVADVEAETTFFGSELQPGDCFNRLDGNPAFQSPDIVSCNELHDEEVYARTVLSDEPGTPFPGDDALFDRAAEFCDPATIDFLGAPWDVVPVDTLLLYPTQGEWEAGDRNILCSAASSELDTKKIGTAAGGTINSDDVVLARASILSDGIEFNDWVVVSEHAGLAAIGSLSDGQFDLPLRRPFGVPVGFIFNATDVDGDGHATTTWGYNWEDRTFTDLGSILPGYQLSSLLVGANGTVFAARETADDDWDIWSTVSGDARVIAGGAGDQRFPTLTPDQSRVVYHDNGNIWVAALDGSDATQLTSAAANDWESIVSPDGQTVVFASDRSGNDDLWAIDIAGGPAVNLTNHPGDDAWPVFSEDGARIYFGSDRLLPEDDRPVIMVMNADGSNQSWFGSSQNSQPIIVPAEIAADVVAAAPTLNERYNYELIEGDLGTTSTWTHSSGRLIVDLPAQWRVGELVDQTGFIAGPRIDRYAETWNVDGVRVSLFDGETEPDFFAIVTATEVQSCDQFDGTDGIVPISEGVVGLSANFNCGDTAVGGVLGFYNQQSGVGVLLEGQRDNEPSTEADSDMLTAIALSLIWE